MENPERLEALVAIMDRLREPGGCPWDREQSYASLRRYLLEECHEVAEALDLEDREALREELGDLLFQIVFLTRLAKEEKAFTIEDVIRGVALKLIRRHPHVFGSESVETAEDVERNWERIKQEEKRERGVEAARSLLDGIPPTLAGTSTAQRLGERAASVGFDWKCDADVFAQIESELSELRAAVATGEPREVLEETGDLLFSVVMLARRLKVDAEGALQRTNHKFRRRFHWIERELSRRGTPIESAGFELLDSLWAEAKAAAE